MIYQENHSFDNLYGEWGKVDGHKVDGITNAPASRTTQVAQDGTPYGCLLQNDVNLTSPTPLPTTCSDPAHAVPNSAFTNEPFTIDDYIGPLDTTCPAPGVWRRTGSSRAPGSPAAARATWSTASTRSSTSSTAASRTAT